MKNDTIIHEAARVGETDIASERKDMQSVKISPNPFIDMLNIGFYNSSANNLITVNIYDLEGRLVFRRNTTNVSVGINTLRLNVGDSNLAPGVYVVKLDVNGRTIGSGKLVRARK